MFSVEKISESITKVIISEVELSSDKKEVVKYGIFAFIQIILSLFWVIVVGLIFDVVIEALIVSFVTSILRKSSGGIHASEPGICMLIGTLVSVLIAIICESIYVDIKLIMLIGIVVFIFSYYLLYKLAPVDSPSKPIKNKKKIRRLKKSSIVILTIYLVIVILNSIAYYITSAQYFNIYSMCICFGIIWQVFSLTTIGYKVLGKIDKLLVVLFYERRWGI